MAEIARLAGIDLTSVEVLDQTLQTDNKANSPGSIELPATPVNSSDAERLTAAQDTLRSMASINQYIQEHPEQQEAVSVLVAVAQGPKGLVQLAVFNAVSRRLWVRILDKGWLSTVRYWESRLLTPWKARRLTRMTTPVPT
ncbi:hypothetical protein HG619_18420 [Pseudomonas syringae]|nr:hypothetical protein [Pseudomonas syringae]